LTESCSFPVLGADFIVLVQVVEGSIGAAGMSINKIENTSGLFVLLTHEKMLNKVYDTNLTHVRACLLPIS
jgi:hypothetical protein